MWLRPVFIGAVAPLVLMGAQALADWRSPIAGAPSILPARFTPQRFAIVAPLAASVPAAVTRPPVLPTWTAPLFDRMLSEAEKAEPLDGGLIEAIARIEPIYDPTRIDGPAVAPSMKVSAGTAVMSDVFGERWRRLSLNANIDRKARPLAFAWQRRDGATTCDAFTKSRPHGFDDPALTAPDQADCATIAVEAVRGYRDQPLAPVVIAWISVPVFAAPLPGSRMSSTEFWAMRRARIEEIQARLRRKWENGAIPASSPLTQARLRP